MNIKTVLASTTACLAISPAFAIVGRHDVAASEYINLGNFGPSTSVGLASGSFSFGSATYIGFGNGSHWALTAGHVPSGNPMQFVNFGGSNITISQSIIAPGYNGGTLARDFALLRLSSDPGVAAIGMTTRTDLAGMTSLFAGYGYHGVGNNPNLSFDGVRRAAYNTIDGHVNFGTNQDFWQTTFQTPTQSGVLPLEGTTAGGDSGGGFFVNDGGTWRLAGCTSWGTEANSSYGDLAYFTTLHTNIDWISQTSGIQAVPEPGTIALGLGIAGLIARRRKARK